MKKFLLTIAMVGSFAVYLAYQRFAVSASPIRPGNVAVPRSSAASAFSASETQVIYKDGQYVGSPADAYYGTVQVKAVVQAGKITDVQFLDYPQDRTTSQMINSQAMPYLKSEAIQAQNANVDIVSGATDTSQAFQQSLSSALAQAR